MKINIYLVVILVLCGCGKKELTKDSEALLEAAAQEKISGTEQEAAEVNGAPHDSSVQAPRSLTKPVEKSAPNVKKSKLEKSKQGEYLVIKFHQNDTEVELVLDPQSTNLNLDLLRGPDGYFEVQKGDSVLYKKNENAVNEKLTSLDRGNLDRENLTEEIIRDINLAQRMFYERKYDDALRVLQQSLDKKKTATAYALGGSIYYVNGDIESAVNAWENALKINPNLEEVRELILRYQN